MSAPRANPIATPQGSLPLKDISDPNPHDVLFGRGGYTQNHSGNKTFRQLVVLNKGLYATCVKSEKAKISQSIVNATRDAGGRFLEKDPKSGLWYDVGDRKALDKTSQALREGQAKLRRIISHEIQSSVVASAPAPSQFVQNPGLISRGQVANSYPLSGSINSVSSAQSNATYLVDNTTRHAAGNMAPHIIPDVNIHGNQAASDQMIAKMAIESILSSNQHPLSNGLLNVHESAPPSLPGNGISHQSCNRPKADQNFGYNPVVLNSNGGHHDLGTHGGYEPVPLPCPGISINHSDLGMHTQMEPMPLPPSGNDARSQSIHVQFEPIVRRNSLDSRRTMIQTNMAVNHVLGCDLPITGLDKGESGRSMMSDISEFGISASALNAVDQEDENVAPDMLSDAIAHLWDGPASVETAKRRLSAASTEKEHIRANFYQKMPGEKEHRRRSSIGGEFAVMESVSSLLSSFSKAGESDLSLMSMANSVAESARQLNSPAAGSNRSIESIFSKCSGGNSRRALMMHKARVINASNLSNESSSRSKWSSYSSKHGSKKSAMSLMSEFSGVGESAQSLGNLCDATEAIQE